MISNSDHNKHRHNDDSEKTKYHLPLAVLFAVLTICGILYWKTYRQSALQPDEADLVSQVITVSHLLNKDDPPVSFLDQMYQQTHIYHDKPPGFYILMAAAYGQFLKFDQLYVVNLPLLLLSVIGVFGLTRRLFGSRAALFAAAFWAFAPANIQFSRFIEQETWLAYLSPLLAWFALSMEKRKGPIPWILIGLFIAAGTYIKQTFILYVIGFFVYPMFKEVMQKKTDPDRAFCFRFVLRPGGGIITAAFSAILVLYIAVNIPAGQNAGTYITQCLNTALSALFLAFIFDIAYRKSRSGSHETWAALYLAGWAGFAFFVLANRPVLFGDLFTATSNPLTNLANGQSIIVNLVFCYYFILFTTKGAGWPKVTKFASALGVLVRRCFKRPESGGIPIILRIVLLAVVIVALYYPFHHHYTDKALLKDAIERRAASVFAPVLLAPVALALTLSFIQIGLLIAGLIRMKWGSAERRVAVWFALPLACFMFVFFNHEGKYFFPALPAMAVLCGRIIDSIDQRKLYRWAGIVFVIASLHLLPMETVSNWFDKFPMRILSLPAEHVRMQNEISTFSRDNDVVENAESLVRFVNRNPIIDSPHNVMIAPSVLEHSKLTDEYLSCLFTFETGGRFNNDVFIESDDEPDSAAFLLHRENSALLNDKAKNAIEQGRYKEVLRLSIEVTPTYALLLSMVEGDLFSWRKHVNPVYVLYSTKRLPK